MKLFHVLCMFFVHVGTLTWRDNIVIQCMMVLYLIHLRLQFLKIPSIGLIGTQELLKKEINIMDQAGLFW